MISIEMTIVLVAFTIACAYFNFRSGHREGVMQGMELTLRLLEADNKIRIVRTKDGNEEIRPIEVHNDRS
tara:strand:+ start:312 stop:521 length:210 start_codon:yes stop_codon:yes gene_type:complete